MKNAMRVRRKPSLISTAAITPGADAVQSPLGRIVNGPITIPSYDPSKPAEALSAFQKAWAEFTAENDKLAVDTAKALGGTNEKLEALNKAMDAFQKDMTKAINDNNEAIARLKLGGDGGKDSREAKARAFYRDVVAQNSKATRAQVHAAISGPVDIEAYAKYVEAFDMLIACNLNTAMLSPDFRNALQTGADPAGGYLIPPERSATWITRIFDTSPMRQYASQLTIGTDRWETIRDYVDGISGGWVGEKAARPETATPTLGVQEIAVHEQYAYPHLTQKMLEDSGLIDAQAWLDQKTQDKMARDETTAFYTGNGKLKPRGFLDYAATAVVTGDKTRDFALMQFVITGSDGGFVRDSLGDNTDCFINIETALHPVFRTNAVWQMNRLTLGAVRKLKNAWGDYRFRPALIAGQPSTLDNFPIVEAEDMPDIAVDAFSIAFGDFRAGYLILDRLGFSVLVDPFTAKPKVGFYIRKRVGGDVTNPAAIKLMKFGDA